MGAFEPPGGAKLTVGAHADNTHDLPSQNVAGTGHAAAPPATDTCLILQYHRVACLCHDPFGLAVQPHNFESQAEYLAENFNVISMDELNHHLTAAAPFADRTVALTFDGGYADVLYTAKDVLQKYRLPAAVFTTSANIIQTGQLWPDELEDLLIAGNPQGPLEIEIDALPCQWPLNTRRDRFRAFEQLYSILSHASPLEQKQILNQIRLTPHSRAEELDCHRTLDAQELRTLEDTGLFTIGGHTHNYVNLSALPKWQQIEELSKNKDVLAEVLGHSVSYLSYPFGNETGCTSETLNVAEELGFALACGNSYGTLSAVDAANRHELPRVRVANLGPFAFHRFLEGFFT